MGVLAGGVLLCIRKQKNPVPPIKDDLPLPLRAEPATFPAGTHLPPYGEAKVCGPIDLDSFAPHLDLVRINDSRVWWESDEIGGNEDDHLIHRSMEKPLRELIELIDEHGGRLKVQDTYRPTGVHSKTSLHKEGRAIDLTCENMTLEKLAKLCWVARFHWVFHEKSGGRHIHASVKW